jgi:UDP-glucose 6-dehydrogenase
MKITEMAEMAIGIIGGGVVGSALGRTYTSYVKEVRVFDLLREKRTHSADETLECNLIFLCTPEGDLDALCSMLGGSAPDGNYVIKSTCSIGATRRLAFEYGLANVVHSPEFLTERTASIDALMPARNIIGGRWDGAPGSNLSYVLKKLYEDRFPEVQVLTMTSDESEAVKLFTNAFFAAKIGFFNEIKSLSDKLGLDWGVVLAGILSDGRISRSHVQVPGHDGKRGFGGKCLPKDLRQLLGCFAEHYVDNFILDAVEDRNLSYDRPCKVEKSSG